MVQTIDLCTRINEDYVCLTHAGHSDRNHNVSTEVLPFTSESASGYVRFVTNYTQHNNDIILTSRSIAVNK